MHRTRAVAGAFFAGILVLTLATVPAHAEDPAVVPDTASSAATTPAGPPAVTPGEAQKALAQAEELADGSQGPPQDGETSPVSADVTAAEEMAHGRSATPVLTQLFRARSELTGANRRAADRILARPVTGAKTKDDLVILREPIVQDCETSTRFCIHYTTKGDDASTPAFAARVATTMDQVHTRLVDQLHYRGPRPDAGGASTPGNPDQKFDVFLGNLSDRGLYGYCVPEGRGRSYCVLDRSFAAFQGGPDRTLPVTAAHEYFHAIQFAYDISEDTWLTEGSAVWAEEQVFDGINDYRQYIRSSSAITSPGLPVDLDTLSGPHLLRVYSAMLFFTHMTETLGTDTMRRVWEAAARHRRYSLQAVRKVVSARMSWPRFMARWSVWNTRPPGYGYSERSLLPRGRFVATRTLGLRTARTAGTFKVRRDHLAAASYRFMVSPKSTTRQRIRFRINGPDTWRGSVATVQMRWTSGRTTYAVVRLNRRGNAVVTRAFGRGKVNAAVVTLTNASTAMVKCGRNAVTVYSCSGVGRFRHDPWTLSATVVR